MAVPPSRQCDQLDAGQGFRLPTDRVLGESTRQHGGVVADSVRAQPGSLMAARAVAVGPTCECLLATELDADRAPLLGGRKPVLRAVDVALPLWVMPVAPGVEEGST